MKKNDQSEIAEKNAAKHTTTGSVFHDLGFNQAESEALEVKAELLNAILGVVEQRGYKQRDLEKLLNQPQPRVSELLNGKISKMSIEKLLDYLQCLGGLAHITVSFEEKPRKRARVAA